MITVYVSIGNSDDRLSQLDWSGFFSFVDRAISAAGDYNGTTIHGRWASLPHEPWQNACWCLEIDEVALADVVGVLRAELADAARFYRQESVAWAEAKTEFIGAS